MTSSSPFFKDKSVFLATMKSLIYYCDADEMRAQLVTIRNQFRVAWKNGILTLQSSNVAKNYYVLKAFLEVLYEDDIDEGFLYDFYE